MQWKSGRLVEMGWSEDELLVCVLDDGTVQIYNVQGRLVQTFSMGSEFREDRVLHCCIWEGGVVCLSRGFCLAYVDNFDEPTVRKMPRLTDLSSNPTCMAIIEPQFTQSKALEVLIAVDKTILLVDMTSVQDQKLTAGPLRRMSVCPNGKMLACFTHDGFVWVITTDFSKNLSEFPTKSLVPPHQVGRADVSPGECEQISGRRRPTLSEHARAQVGSERGSMRTVSEWVREEQGRPGGQVRAAGNTTRSASPTLLLSAAPSATVRRAGPLRAPRGAGRGPQMVWCGTDSVVLYWDQLVLMVGPYGDWVKYAYDEPVFLVAEADAVRLYTTSPALPPFPPSARPYLASQYPYRASPRGPSEGLPPLRASVHPSVAI